MTNISLFSQIISKLDRQKFAKLVKNKQTDKHQKGYNSWTHLVSMLFCQFAKSQSVRDISNGLRSATGNLNHLGIDRAPSKSTISYQNKHRSWELFRDYYYVLLESLGQHTNFKQVKFKIKSKIFALSEVGLQYVQLGQASNTLSGGEAQRIKLASFLSSSKIKQKKLFIFDEPTTGLHFHDVKKLIKALQDLVEMGHHVIIIEHHMDIIKSADWIIDLGPEGGKEGGTLLYEGNPDDFIKSDVLSYTKDYLKKCIEFKQPQIPQK